MDTLKRKLMTDEDELEVLKKMKLGSSKSSILQDYKISDATYRKLMTRVRYLKNKKSKKSSGGTVLDAVVLKWFVQVRDRGEHITGTVIQKKACVLNEKLNGSNSTFKASNLWLHEFKKRHGIRKYQMKQSTTYAQRFKQFLSKNIDLKQFSVDNIYNADESGIYWRTLASWLLEEDHSKKITTKEEILTRETKGDRLSGLFCCNASGDHRIPLLLVGNSEVPKSLSSFKIQKVNESIKFFESLDVFYTHHMKSWIDRRIFLLWYKDVFIPQVLEYQKTSGTAGKVILILDNGACHSDLKELNSLNKNFQVVLLHNSIMPVNQPMGQDLILETKKFYKKSLLKHILFKKQIQDPTDFLKNLDLGECFAFLSMAWNSLKLSTIQKAWKPFLGDKSNNIPDSSPDDQADDKVFESSANNFAESLSFPHEIETELIQLLSKPGCPAEMIKAHLLEWFEVEHVDCGWEPLTDDEIVELVLNNEREKNLVSTKAADDSFEIPEMLQVTKFEVFEDDDNKETIDTNEESLIIPETQIITKTEIFEDENREAENVNEDPFNSLETRPELFENQNSKEATGENEDPLESSERQQIGSLDDFGDESGKEPGYENNDPLLIPEIKQMTLPGVFEDKMELKGLIKSEIDITSEIIVPTVEIRGNEVERCEITQNRVIDNRIEENRIERNVVRGIEEIDDGRNAENRVEESDIREVEEIQIEENLNVGIGIRRNNIQVIRLDEDEIEEIGIEENQPEVIEIGDNRVEEIMLGENETQETGNHFLVPVIEEIPPSDAFKGLMEFKKWLQSCDKSLQQHHCYIEELENLLTQ